MKQLFAVLWLAALSQAAFAQTASEKAAKRLVELLSNGAAAPALPSRPMQGKAAGALEQFEASIPPYAGVPVRLPKPPRNDPKPAALHEATPLLAFQDNTASPAHLELATMPLIRLPSVDVHTPLPIPILAQPAKDRAALGEPGFEASLDAALKPFTATRDRPVPFAPLNLPDPFENLRHGQLRNAPEENVTPPVVPYQKPTK